MNMESKPKLNHLKVKQSASTLRSQRLGLKILREAEIDSVVASNSVKQNSNAPGDFRPVTPAQMRELGFAAGKKFSAIFKKAANITPLAAVGQARHGTAWRGGVKLF